MPKSSTTLKQGDKLPNRGRGNKGKVLEGIMAAIPVCASPEEAEKEYFKRVALRAFDADDQSSPMLLKLLGDKAWSNVKPSLDPVQFDFPMNGTPAERAFAVVDAISKGALSPDVGAMIVGIVKDAIVIEESTVLKEQLEEVRKVLEMA